VYPHPALSDGRIALRKWRETDLDCVRLAGTDPRIPRGTTVPSSYTAAEGVAFIHRQWKRAEDGEGLSQAIVESDGDRAIGLLWLAMRPQAYVGGLGYWVVPPARGAGVATAAIRLIVPWAWEALRFRRIEAWVEPGNVASQRVLERAGFEQEGRLRNFLNDGSSDALVFAIIPPVG
jgi:RimJ/RimL family protein N-acetyltransferase